MPKSAKFFGTDGIRGIANTELTPELAFKLGEAAVACLGKRIVIGRDTRRSGVLLESMLVAGIISAGGDALCCGIIPTPAIAYLTQDEQANGGVVISASHNPAEYNGIKLFSASGTKLSEEQETQIETYLSYGCAELKKYREATRQAGDKVGQLIKLKDATDRYVTHALSTLSSRKALFGMRIVLDCGHGASYQSSVEAFERAGADLIVINNDFDGLNINENCGSTHLEFLAQKVCETGAQIGIAHDGDADRMLAVDEKGQVIDGDYILSLAACALKEQGRLKNNMVVATVMSNLGFQNYLKSQGIEVELTQVGDKYVFQKMQELGAVLGGEQSGHILFLEHNLTGDGLVSALQLADILASSSKTLSELRAAWTPYPQALINVAVKNKEALYQSAVLQHALEEATAELGERGRILLRPSGTEPLIRVMVEAQDEELAQSYATRLAKLVHEELT